MEEEVVFQVGDRPRSSAREWQSGQVGTAGRPCPSTRTSGLCLGLQNCSDCMQQMVDAGASGPVLGTDSVPSAS